MKRRVIINIIIIVFIGAFVTLFVTSKINEMPPEDEEFYGVLKSFKRIYPGLLVFRFEYQEEEYQMANELEKFKASLYIGDSISKPKGDPYIYVFKKVDGNYRLYEKFVYE